jgi:hypothetical protein
MCLNYRMGKIRRITRKRRTARKRQNGGVFGGAPVSYSIPFGQRQPNETIMERATTAGGNYPNASASNASASNASASASNIVRKTGAKLRNFIGTSTTASASNTLKKTGAKLRNFIGNSTNGGKRRHKRTHTKHNKRN